MRTRRKSSWPAGTTAPTVASRAEMMPSSGASTWVIFRRNCCDWTWACADCTRACADWTRARAVWAAVRYWAICWALSAPLGSTAFARSALACASADAACDSASPARASASAASALARSARTVSVAKTARTCPRLTAAPTSTRTSAIRKPLTSAPIEASCQALMLPLADSVSAMSLFWGRTVLTTNAGRLAGGAAEADDAAWAAVGTRSTRPSATLMTPMSTATLTEVIAPIGAGATAAVGL